MGFDSEDPYPCLLVDSSKEEEVPNLDIAGTYSILNALKK